MMHGPTSRLAVALLVSALVHAVVLQPLRAPVVPFVPNPFAKPMDVRLYPEPVPAASTIPAQSDHGAIAGLPVVPSQNSGPLSVPGKAVVDSRPAMIPPPLQDTQHRADVTTPAVRQPAQSQVPDVSNATPRLRTALPDEAAVFVRRYDAKSDGNPTAVMQLATGKYFYFNAPQLKQAAYPLNDAVAHYPANTLEHPHGAVKLLLFIDEKGDLERIAVECANPAFEDSAKQSVQNVRFNPARDADGPVKAYMQVEFRYGLGEPCGRPPHDPKLNINSKGFR